MQPRQCLLCAETNLQVRLFISQTVDGFHLINQSVTKQFYRVEYLIIGSTTHNKVIICRIFSATAVQNEIQPFLFSSLPKTVFDNLESKILCFTSLPPLYPLTDFSVALSRHPIYSNANLKNVSI